MARITAQKRALHDEIKKFNSFFDVEKLQEKTSKQGIGLATVYRFLNALEKEGSIHSFMCGNRKIYSADKTSHAHFKCEQCRTLKHIKIRNIDFIKEIANGEICHFQIELVGICSECRN